MITRTEATLVSILLEQSKEQGDDIYNAVLEKYQNQYPAYMYDDKYYDSWKTYEILMTSVYGEDFFGID